MLLTAHPHPLSAPSAGGGYRRLILVLLLCLAAAGTPSAAAAAASADEPAARTLAAQQVSAPAGLVLHRSSDEFGEFYEVFNTATGQPSYRFSAAGPAALSPDGRRVAYVGGDGVLVQQDGAGHAEAVPGVRGVRELAWSPDSTRLAYTTGAAARGAGTCATRLSVVAFRGTEPRVLRDEVGVAGLSWSPDNSALAVGYDADVPSRRIVVVPVDRGAPRTLVQGGTGPLWSPDGNAIAFSHGGGVSLVRPDGSQRTDLLPPGAGPYSLGDWSPDGSTLAVTAADGEVGSVSRSGLLVRSGERTLAGSRLDWMPVGDLLVFAAPGERDVPTLYTVPPSGGERVRLTSGQDPQAARMVTRLAGASRDGTAVSVARLTTVGGAVIARNDLFPDALAAGPLARKLGVPLLLSTPTGISPELDAEIRRLGTTAVYLIGDNSALGPQVVADLREAGVRSFQRVAGADRYSTAAEIARLVGGDQVYLASGTGFADAAAISGLAAFHQRPILLTAPGALPSWTRSYLQLSRPTAVTVVGGTSAVSADVAAEVARTGATTTRIGGSTRYETSAAIADASVRAGLGEWPWLANGRNWPDALAAGPGSAQARGPLLLVDPQDLTASPASAAWLAFQGTYRGVVAVGGPDVLSPRVTTQAIRTRNS